MTSAVTTLAAEDARERDAERVVAAMWLAEMRRVTPVLTLTALDELIAWLDETFGCHADDIEHGFIIAERESYY